jgi:AcrR family transcriptional regulator
VRTADPARRLRILGSAAQLFAQRHYHEVRMDDIAAEAGVAKGTLYLHFRDKEALYLALILDAVQGLLAEVEARVSDTEDAERKVRVLVREVVRFFDRNPYLLELVERVKALQPGGDGSPLQVSRTRFLGLMMDALCELNSSGRFVVPDVEFAALSLAGITREVLRFYPRPWPEDLPSRIVGQFLNGLRPPDDAGANGQPAR